MHNIEKVFECSDIETVFNKLYKIILICLYKAPTGNIGNFLYILDTILNKKQQESKYFIIAGDFSLNLLVDGTNQRSFLI